MDGKGKVIKMESWIVTAQEAVRRSPVVRAELRHEATVMLNSGEYDAARRIFEDILEEATPEIDAPVDVAAKSPAGGV